MCARVCASCGSYLLSVVRRRMPYVFSVAICDLQGCERSREGVAKPVVRFRTCVEPLCPIIPSEQWMVSPCVAHGLCALCVCRCVRESRSQVTMFRPSPPPFRPPVLALYSLPALAPCLRSTSTPLLSSALRSFSERYCRNDHYAGGKAGAPILFYTGNESPVQEYVNNTGLMWDLAASLKARVVFAEHRYFGESVPKVCALYV